MRNQPITQTEQVKQNLLCIIKDSGLKPGDRIPSQKTLREKLHVGSATIQRAVQSLTQAGLLEPQPNIGVVLRREPDDSFTARHIGIAYPWLKWSASTANVLRALVFTAQTQNCQCRLFLRNIPQMQPLDKFSLFDGLKRCIDERIIQGLICCVNFDEATLEHIQAQNFPMVSMGLHLNNPGFKVDCIDYFDRSMSIAQSLGAVRPAIIFWGWPITASVQHSFQARWDLPLEQYFYPLTPNMREIEEPVYKILPTLHGVLHKILQLPKSQRPDILLLPDDYIAVISLQYLHAHAPNWNPPIIYIQNKQNPMIDETNLEGGYFLFDDEHYAKQGIALLLDILKGKRKTPCTITLEPEFRFIGRLASSSRQLLQGKPTSCSDE